MQLAPQYTHHDDERFQIDLSPFGFHFSLVIHPWQDGLTLERHYHDGTIEALEGSIDFSLSQIAHSPGGVHWVNTIPDHLIDLVEPYPDLGVYMLSLAATNRRAKDLLITRPIMLYFICQAYPLDREQAIALCQFGQREILHMLGFASSKGALRFLDKIDVTFNSRSTHTQVTRLLHPIAERYRYFNHYPTINEHALQLDMLLPYLTGSKLAHGLTQTSLKNRVRLPTLLNETVQLGLRLGYEAPMDILGQLDSVEAVIQLHDNWVQRRRANEYVPCPTHNSPYPVVFTGNEHIEPITHYFALREEGETLQHCVEVYHSRILKGEYLAFKMTAPERMTIGIRIILRDDAPPFYDIEQIKGLKNKAPKDATIKAVYQWLDAEKKHMNGTHQAVEHLH
ncbi:PcfJ domain-containing protein [Photobacterium japonica]|uniref:PcfJ domain-containing protein n=1 Tax=Photobacterium japonica TaxID=2910235 RepID=UPI003D099AA5